MNQKLEEQVKAKDHRISELETRLAALERLVSTLNPKLLLGQCGLTRLSSSGKAGREIEGPMAIVILGGLVTSTVLNLLLLPTLALRHGEFSKTD